MKHVAIIGGGFSGILTAVNLARFSANPVKITIINNGFPLARGIAYSTRNGNHLLNVAARNMSALADQPNDFVEWLHTRSEYYEEPLPRLREKFVPRSIYGDYIHSLLLSYSSGAAKGKAHLEIIACDAVDVVPADAGHSVLLSDGRQIAVDAIVLATGNQLPGNLPLKGLDPAHPRYFQNPWANWEGKLTDRTENVVLIGTGLTMIDVFVSLEDRGWKGKIFAVSRNGLLPLAHFKGVEYTGFPGSGTDAIRLAEILAAFNREQRHIKTMGINPAILVDKLRPWTQQIWRGFSLREKRSFHRHLRSRWNVARHRIAPSLHQQLLESIAAHRLEIVKGRLWELTDCGDQFVLSLKTGKGFRRIDCGALINCTGPGESYSRTAAPLYQNLFSRGSIQPDEMDMGISVTPDFAVVDKQGTASGVLFALGPILKGSLWESSAVPELRSQAIRLAETLARRFFSQKIVAIKEAGEPILEYEI